MPVEGQWERAITPLRKRDRRVLAAAAVVAALALVALVVALAHRRGAAPDAGCVVVDVASTMGGAKVRSCGADAHVFCRTQGRRNRTVAAACRRQGYAADLGR